MRCHYVSDVAQLSLRPLISLVLLITTLVFSNLALAYDGVKPTGDQEHLPEHLNSGTQFSIGHNHYLLLDQVRAFADQHDQLAGDELSKKGRYSIRASSAAENPVEWNPVVWSQSNQRYAVILDELGLVLHDINQAESLAARYGLTLTTRLSRLKRAYYQVSAQKIPELMRQLQRDTRVREVLPSLLERERQAM